MMLVIRQTQLSRLSQMVWQRQAAEQVSRILPEARGDLTEAAWRQAIAARLTTAETVGLRGQQGQLRYACLCCCLGDEFVTRAVTPLLTAAASSGQSADQMLDAVFQQLPAPRN